MATKSKCVAKLQQLVADLQKRRDSETQIEPVGESEFVMNISNQIYIVKEKTRKAYYAYQMELGEDDFADARPLLHPKTRKPMLAGTWNGLHSTGCRIVPISS